MKMRNLGMLLLKKVIVRTLRVKQRMSKQKRNFLEQV